MERDIGWLHTANASMQFLYIQQQEYSMLNYCSEVELSQSQQPLQTRSRPFAT